MSYKTLKLAASFIEVSELGKNIHRKLDIPDLRRSNPLDFGVRYPGCADDSTGIVFPGQSLCCDVVSDGKFARVAILQIRDAILRQTIRCYFPEEMLNEAFTSFRKRVEISGFVHYRRNGVPISIEVVRIDQLPDDQELPSPEDVRGILRTAT